MTQNAATPQFPFASPEWFKSLTGTPGNLSMTVKETLEFGASCFQDQADHLRRLAGCENPAEAVKCQLEFAQQSWSRSVGEAFKLFNSLRPSGSTSA
jgi:hypothetical protein